MNLRHMRTSRYALSIPCLDEGYRILCYPKSSKAVLKLWT
jgi:hypothetical protein